MIHHRKDDKTNALILTDKATNIKAVMRIIFELDKGGLRDKIEIIPLYYTSATLIENLFNTKLLAKPQQPGVGAGATPTPDQVSYFPKNTKIIGLPRNNTLVIMGTSYSIDLVRDFIIKYICWSWSDHNSYSKRCTWSLVQWRRMQFPTFLFNTKCGRC